MVRIYQKSKYKGGHYVELLQSGEPFFSAVEKLIDDSRQFIHFHAYLIDEDETGNRIINALIRASLRGVRVYLLLDALGTRHLSKELIEKIEDSGILFRFFSPTFITKGFQLSLRLHAKVVLCDGEVAVIGGINFADRYHGTPEKREWLDFAVLMRGPECIHVLSVLKKLWNRRFIPKTELSRETVNNPRIYKEDIKLRVVQNNWYRNKIEILRSYRSAFKNSRDRMIILASYFLPGRNERRLLRNASLRGVDIKIMLAAESDMPVFKRATRFLYDFILRSNIKIYEYLPSNLHAKVAVVDGQWCTIGSYNLNHVSDYASIEVNVNILDNKFASELETLLHEILRNDCRQITIEEHQRASTLLSRFSGWLFYQIIRLLMKIMYQMTSKKKKSIQSGIK
ncbi:MAG: phospholipase D-like domain-containing protein [Bacteroidales bacterium]|jgi:cardiolipin synthase